MGTYIKAQAKSLDAASASAPSTHIYQQLNSLPDNEFSPLEYVPIPSFICKFGNDENHQLLSCNLPFRSLFNIEEDSSNTVARILPISFANSICNKFSNQEMNDQVLRCTEKVNLDGTICELDITLSPIYAGTDDIAYISGTVNDIKKLETIESNAADKFKHLQTAFNNVPGIIAIINAEGTHEFANHEYLRFFNKRFTELETIHSNQLFSAYDDQFDQKINSSLEGIDNILEIKHLTASNKWVTIIFTISPYYLSDGTIDGVIIFGHEVNASQEVYSEELAYKHLDPLTKLLDRKSCIAHVEKLINSYKKSDKNKDFSLLSIDLKNFKNINENIGHDSADKLLEKIARRVESSIRQKDIVFRIGGNEFLCVMEDISFDSLKVTSKRILNSIEEPYSVQNIKTQVSASFGSATYPNDGKTPNKLIGTLNKTLQYAKEHDRSTLIEFDGTLNEKLQRSSSIITELHQALANNEFYLAYQPIIDLESLTPVGVESLIRWENKLLGNVPPNEFIPIAEESDLIDQIGEYVLRQSCMDLARIQRETGNENFSISVNTSARQFKRHKLFYIVKECLEESGISPECLELEITERQLIHDFEGAASELEDITDLGVKLSIDDFGNGYSSFSTLRSIPFDTLKIDRIFIHDITSRAGAFTLVKTIASMTQVLGLNAVAEGIETRAQLNLLRNFAGCKYAQGFYFSRPIPYEDLIEFIAQSDNQDYLEEQ